MRNKPASIIGILAASAVILIGMLVPKALLWYEEARLEWDGYASYRVMLDVLPTVTPANDRTGPEQIQRLSAAKRLLEGEASLTPRDPAAYELTMEEAAKAAVKELSALIEKGAAPGFALEEYSFRHGILKGYDAACSAEASMNGLPVGLWLMSFEDGSGHTLDVVCDSRNGLIYSVAYDWNAAFGGEETEKLLAGFAGYLGLPTENGYFFEMRGIFGFLYVGEFCLYADSGLPHAMGIWSGGDAVYPTPIPTPTPAATEAPHATPTPTPAP